MNLQEPQIEFRQITEEHIADYRKIQYAILWYFYMLENDQNNIKFDKEEIINQLVHEAGLHPICEPIILDDIKNIILKNKLLPSDYNGNVVTAIDYYSETLRECLQNCKENKTGISQDDFRKLVVDDIKLFSQKYTPHNLDTIIESLK